MTVPFRLLRALWSVPAILAALWTASPASAQGDLLIAPTRIVLNGAGSAEVVLNNIGEQPATYRKPCLFHRIQNDIRRQGIVGVGGCRK